MTDHPSSTSTTITRSFAATDLEVGDGRTIVGRLVPYGEVARVADGLDEPYDEVWVPGAFRRVVRAADRVLLNYEHRAGLLDQIARCTSLVDGDGGLDGEFRAFDGPVGDHGLELVRSKAVTGLSVAARVPARRRVRDDGVVERHLATMIEHVALTAAPAYAGAAITAVRHVGPELVDEAPPVHITEIRAWLDEARVRFPTSS